MRVAINSLKPFCLPPCLSGCQHTFGPHKFDALFQRCYSSATKQDVLAGGLHCNGVDALKKETRGELCIEFWPIRYLCNYALHHAAPTLPPQSPIFAIMHGKPGLFTSCQFLPRIPLASKQSGANCIRRLEILTKK